LRQAARISACSLEFELPAIAAWRRWIDTGLETPDDIVPWQDAPWVGGRTYRAAPRSVIALWGC